MVVVDGPAGLSDATRAVMLLADLVLTPVQPAGADLRSAVEVLRLVTQARPIRGGLPDAAVFLNRATKGTRLLSEAREVLGGLEGFRALGQAITHGRPCPIASPRVQPCSSPAPGPRSKRPANTAGCLLSC